VPETNRKFLILFALANAGGVVAYAPLLTLIFPARIWEIAGASAIHWLGVSTFAGAMAASIGNVAFGWASDLVGSRRHWVSVGLTLTIASYVALFFASSLMAIVTAVVVYQLSLNMMLAPLTAWAADTVPDEQKGMLGGWLAAGAPIGAFAGVAATSPWLTREWMQFAIICALIFALVTPVLLLNRSSVPRPIDPGRRDPVQLRMDFGLLWLARLIVQVAGAVLFSFLLFYFKSISQPVTQSTVAIISATTLTVAFPTTILIGRLSDRWGPRKPFLIAAVIIAAIGLLTMAAQETTSTAILGYAIFEWSIAIFLALHSAYAMQVLPSPSRRGRDMGILNLTNTLPSLIAPVLAVWLVPGHGYPTLFAVLAALMVVATICLALIRTDKQLALENRPA
jgi:MFS family permease